MADALTDIVAEAQPIECIATGFDFVEGPVWHTGRQALLFSDIAASRQYRWDAASGVRLLRLPSNQANGNALDNQGRLVSCEHASSCLVRHEHEGKLVAVLASHYEGRALNSPNDVIVDSHDRIWFTDPAFGRLRADLGVPRAQELDFQGVFRRDPDGRLALVARDFRQPNGLCLSADEKQLFVNDSWAMHVKVFDVEPDGSLRNESVWAVISGDGEGVPDGMKLTEAGHLLCNGPGGIHVFSAAGVWLGVIGLPEKSTNFVFGGADHCELYITACTSVYRLRTRVPGLPCSYTQRLQQDAQRPDR